MFLTNLLPLATLEVHVVLLLLLLQMTRFTSPSQLQHRLAVAKITLARALMLLLLVGPAATLGTLIAGLLLSLALQMKQRQAPLLPLQKSLPERIWCFLSLRVQMMSGRLALQPLFARSLKMSPFMMMAYAALHLPFAEDATDLQLQRLLPQLKPTNDLPAIRILFEKATANEALVSAASALLASGLTETNLVLVQIHLAVALATAKTALLVRSAAARRPLCSPIPMEQARFLQSEEHSALLLLSPST